MPANVLAPTPEWAESQMDLIINGNTEEQLNAALGLLAAVAPTLKEQKYKHELAWAAIEYGYKKTDDCRRACREFVGVIHAACVVFGFLVL